MNLKSNIGSCNTCMLVFMKISNSYKLIILTWMDLTLQDNDMCAHADLESDVDGSFMNPLVDNFCHILELLMFKDDVLSYSTFNMCFIACFCLSKIVTKIIISSIGNFWIHLKDDYFKRVKNGTIFPSVGYFSHLQDVDSNDSSTKCIKYANKNFANLAFLD